MKPTGGTVTAGAALFASLASADTITLCVGKNGDLRLLMSNRDDHHLMSNRNEKCGPTTASAAAHFLLTS
jgi:hypothetical protein